MSALSMQGYLLETLVWTAVLIAAVLLLRRPVTRWFGAQYAYALWALPALRLIVPPIELPAWMRPAESEGSGGTAAVSGENPLVILDPVIPVATRNDVHGSEAAATDLPAATTPMSGFDMGSYLEPALQAGIALWLIGAAIFLYLRFAAYFQLRDELLADARDMGREGDVRLIETPGTEAPLAFGVIDKVIALPPGFLALADRQARDLALAHEMAHHQGRDLLVNVLVQPLFALHWFNPLGRYGWLALRRDQEAACDARVMAAAPVQQCPDMREAYANLIVSFAAGQTQVPNHALTAPMACPVLGEKSIVHRLRSLKMNDTPKSRRLAGRLMLGAAVVALPLTASISYAATEAPLAPPAPPAAPAVSAIAPLAPLPPAPPAPPAPPTAPLLGEPITSVDPDVDVEVSTDGQRSEQVFVIRSEEAHKDSHGNERRFVSVREFHGDRQLSDVEIEQIVVEVRSSLEEARQQLDELPMIIEQSLRDVEGAQGRKMTIEMSCDGDDAATTIENADGTQVVKICRANIMAEAVEGLREARDEIASETEMDAKIRDRVLQELDTQIERWESSRS